jgi:hypothetical protein
MMLRSVWAAFYFPDDVCLFGVLIDLLMLVPSGDINLQWRMCLVGWW